MLSVSMYSLYTVIAVKNNRAIVIYYNNTVNTSITGLLPNTTYTCCVLAVTSYGERESDVRIISTSDKSKFYGIIKHWVPLHQVLTLIVPVTCHLLLNNVSLIDGLFVYMVSHNGRLYR